MSDTKAKEPKAPIDFSHLGGKKLLDGHGGIKGEKEISFAEIGGKVVLRSPLWVEIKPAESVEKEDDARK